MLSRRYNRRLESTRKKRSNSFFRITTIFLVVTCILVLTWIRPLLSRAAVVQGRILASNSLTSLMAELLSDNDNSLDELVEILRDDSGNVTGLSTNGQKAIFMQNVFADKVTGMLSDGNGREYQIPLGTLLGGGVLSGRGPNVPLKIIPMGYTSAELITQLDTTGINQSTISVYLNITMEYTTMLPLASAMDTVEERYLVAQTTIVGKVPQFLGHS